MKKCKPHLFQETGYFHSLRLNLSNMFIVAAFMLLTPLITNATTATPGADTFNLSEIAPGIYLHKGVHVTFEHEQHDDIANIGFIIGDNCIAVIDTGGSVLIGNKLLKTIRKISDKPVCYVINTHIHFDHVLGNFAFAKEKPVFIGHENLKTEIENNRVFFLEKFTKDLGPNPTPESIIGPSIGVVKTKELDLGNRKLLLTAYPAAHSYSDLTVMDFKTGTFWASDLIFRQRIPSLTGNLKGWLTTMESLIDMNVKLVVPGHGPTAKTMSDALTDQQRYLDNLLEETRKAIADGSSLDEALEHVGHEEKLHWLLHEQHHKANVIKAFTELEWE